MVQTDPLIFEPEDVCEPEPAQMPIFSEPSNILDLPFNAAQKPSIRLPKPNEKDWHECPLALYARLTTMYDMVVKRGSISIDSIEDPNLAQMLSAITASDNP